ncbi:MAG: hypothetical protein ACKPKO_59930, partial [Candidatus Fonsibacter sp.]
MVSAALEQAVVVAVLGVTSVGLHDLLASGVGDSLKGVLACSTPAMPAHSHRDFNQFAAKGGKRWTSC